MVPVQIPLRGRSGSVVGVLIGARVAESSSAVRRETTTTTKKNISKKIGVTARSDSESDVGQDDGGIIEDIIMTTVEQKERPVHLFSWEDVSAAETTAALASVGLFWCNGLGALHHVINKNVNKMDKLEKIVKKLGEKTK